MPTLLLLINLAACAVICAVAMFFYLRHCAPACLRHHFNQVALIMVSVGAFASAVAALKAGQLDWFRVVLNVGVAMFAGKSLWQWRTQQREPTP